MMIRSICNYSYRRKVAQLDSDVDKISSYLGEHFTVPVTQATPQSISRTFNIAIDSARKSLLTLVTLVGRTVFKLTYCVHRLGVGYFLVSAEEMMETEGDEVFLYAVERIREDDSSLYEEEMRSLRESLDQSQREGSLGLCDQFGILPCQQLIREVHMSPRISINMNSEIDALRTELAGLEAELQLAKDEHKQKEEQSRLALETQKEKWRKKHELLAKSIKESQSAYESEKRKYQGQMQTLNDKLQTLKEQSNKEEQDERRFLLQLDAELVAVAGRAKARLRDESVNCESDTLQDSMCEESPRPDTIMKLISNIAKARELLQALLERSSREPARIPPLALSPGAPPDVPSISKTLSDSVRDSSIYSKVLINDEVLNSLTMSEREAVVYSIINAGAGPEQRRDVQLEDLLNITPEEKKSLLLTSARFEDLSSIIEEESGCDSPPDPIALTFTLPDVKEDLNSSGRSPSMNKPAGISLSPLSTPRSGLSQVQSQSYLYSERASQLSASGDLDRGRIEDLSGQIKVGSGETFQASEIHKIHIDLEDLDSAD